MARAGILYENHADLAGVTITCPDALAGAPASNLIDPHVGTKMRANVDATTVLIDLGSAMSLDTVMLAGLSGIDPTLRVRMSMSDPTGVDGAVHDSDDTAPLTGLPNFDPDYALFVYLISVPVSARYILINCSEIGVDYIEAGRLALGERQAFGFDYQAPWRRTAVRRSVDTFGIGPQVFVDHRQGFWRVNASFSSLVESERNGFLEEIGVAIVNDGHLDMLWINDPDSDNLSRDCIWGYHEGDYPVTQDVYTDPPVYSAEFIIRQRG